MDVYDQTIRSAAMRAVKSRNTGAELAVRKALHAAGYRYRLHRKDLPGKPDIVFPARRKIVFVHGCFWHQHPGCKAANRPASNAEYWNTKLDGNVMRDAQHVAALESMGWSVLILWECHIHDKDAVMSDLRRFLEA